MKIECLSLIIASLSALATLYVWITHGRKINKFQIEKIEKERLEEKQATIKGNFIKPNGGKRVLKVFNSGKAEALNIRVEILDKIDGILSLLDDPSPYEKLDPQYGFEIIFIAYEGASGVPLKIKFIWDDESSKNRESIQVIQI